MSLATCLKELRSERKWTQGDLCRATGFERAYVSRLESGKVKDLGLRNAMKIARAFGLSVEELVRRCHGDEWDSGHQEKPRHVAVT